MKLPLIFKGEYMDQSDFLNKIKERVLHKDADASLILFGSRARGDYREDSDWDILVLTSKVANAQLKNKIQDEIYDLELEFTQPVSTLIYEKEDWKTMLLCPYIKTCRNKVRFYE